MPVISGFGVRKKVLVCGSAEYLELRVGADVL